jgi:hypothetical protein
MNYKKLIRSRALRIKILSLLSWVPDAVMLYLQYRIHTGRTLHLRHPRRFTEKLQLYKLRYRNPQMLRCTDKYEVRQYVAERGLKDILVPLIGVYSDPCEIDFDRLPCKFVAKTTDGGGGNQVFVCRDKSHVDRARFMQLLQGWMAQPKAKKTAGREWAYENGYPRRLLIEHLLEDGVHRDIPDYKFFCFNGKVAYVYGISDRQVGVSAQFGVYDRDFHKLDVVRMDERPQAEALPRPENYEQMVQWAEQLAAPFPEVRVDLYNLHGQIYFGELTFYDGSGYMQFSPDAFDFEMGSKFDVSEFSE